jgi:hypothetical protein
MFVTTIGAIVVVALALASSANPTPPGRNGLIAFVTHTYSADVGLRKLTHDTRPRACLVAGRKALSLRARWTHLRDEGWRNGTPSPGESPASGS